MMRMHPAFVVLSVMQIRGDFLLSHMLYLVDRECFVVVSSSNTTSHIAATVRLLLGYEICTDLPVRANAP